ncbi:hypothetical protein KP509_37G003500 [Ceratopteris richardii]|uniref:Uncharacterized protein n=1 Tax=Ceratopteris richardii TaxID=49495 RepID=A0A8T2Q6Y9_CERRI|nr:hypothetical protein KP509_37G003500 [Ceratopteris richardii]
MQQQWLSCFRLLHMLAFGRPCLDSDHWAPLYQAFGPIKTCLLIGY